jgi:ATPase complex subunit ATP10
VWTTYPPPNERLAIELMAVISMALRRSLARSSAAARRVRGPASRLSTALLSSAAKGGADKPKGDAAAASKAAKMSSPVQNLRDVMDALDVMIEEAEKKVVKKYRPNMFAEFKQLNDTDGKVAVGPDELVDVGKAKLVPSLALESLDGQQADLKDLVTSGKVSLVLTSFKNFGLNMLPAWREAFSAAFPPDKHRNNVQVLSVNIIEDWYMKLVQSSIRRGLKEATPAELHATTFARFGRCDDFRTPMDLNNSFVGYAHLVDGKGRIRWM